MERTGEKGRQDTKPSISNRAYGSGSWPEGTWSLTAAGGESEVAARRAVGDTMDRAKSSGEASLERAKAGVLFYVYNLSTEGASLGDKPDQQEVRKPPNTSLDQTS